MIVVNKDYHITVSTFASLFHDCILPHETIDYCMQRDWQSPKSTEYAHDTDSCSSVMACILTILRSTFYPLTYGGLAENLQKQSGKLPKQKNKTLRNNFESCKNNFKTCKIKTCKNF